MYHPILSEESMNHGIVVTFTDSVINRMLL